MLTADLVHVRRRGDRLSVVPLSEAEQPRAHEIATTAIALVRSHLGLTRGALAEAWSQVAIAPAESRLARALYKLALDACEFEEGTTINSVELRREVFTRTAVARGSSLTFDRGAVLAHVAAARGVPVDALEQALYADLPDAHVLRQARLTSPLALLAQYELACHQAVLLRAVSVRSRLHCATAAGYRTLFRSLKFHRLLFTITPLNHEAGYALDIDGPMSLFEQTTKYGLRLALALPAIMACDRWEMNAELRWGKDRQPLRYHLRGGHVSTIAGGGSGLADEVAALLADLRVQSSDWLACPADAILSAPGIGVCVPDLELVHRTSGQRVFLEVLGFWSRNAVWKRIEMAQAGLPSPVVFALSKHLRVSEEAIPENASAALYVYARTMNARAVLERVDAVANRKPNHGEH